MKLRFLGCLVAGCLVAVGWVGCTDGDETHWMCLGGCGPSRATFTLATRLSGRELAIAVGFPDGSEERINCQPGDGSIACIPVTSRVQPKFAANGALESLAVDSPPFGTYAVQIAVDGAPAAAGSFDYQSTSTVTVGACPGTTVSCGGMQAFTIGN